MSEISERADKLIFELERLAEVSTPNNPNQLRIATRKELRDFIADLESQLSEAQGLLKAYEKKALVIKFVNEDELPKGIRDDVYAAMFNCSHVYGVRLFPYIEENGKKYFLIWPNASKGGGE